MFDTLFVMAPARLETRPAACVGRYRIHRDGRQADLAGTEHPALAISNKGLTVIEASRRDRYEHTVVRARSFPSEPASAREKFASRRPKRSVSAAKPWPYVKHRAKFDSVPNYFDLKKSAR